MQLSTARRFDGRLTKTIAAVVLALGAFACSSPAISCRVSTDDYAAPEDGVVTYTASVTGAATIKSVMYLDRDQSITADSPKVPFEMKIPVAGGASVDITVYGSIDNDAEGNVLAGYSFLGTAAGDSYVFSSTCR
jgi:hypothetical protein